MPTENIPISLGDSLSKVLKKRNLTLRSVAKATGVPASSIFEWTTGRTPKNLRSLAIVANHLEIPICVLLFGKICPLFETCYESKDDISQPVIDKLIERLEKENYE